eukprot:6739-Heterococcus_DN1.PRE.2
MCCGGRGHEGRPKLLWISSQYHLQLWVPLRQNGSNSFGLCTLPCLVNNNNVEERPLLVRREFAVTLHDDRRAPLVAEPRCHGQGTHHHFVAAQLYTIQLLALDGAAVGEKAVRHCRCRPAVRIASMQFCAWNALPQGVRHQPQRRFIGGSIRRSGEEDTSTRFVTYQLHYCFHECGRLARARRPKE